MKMDDLYLTYSDGHIYITDGKEQKDITYDFYATVVDWLIKDGEDIKRKISEQNKNPYWEYTISMKSKLCFEYE